MSASDRAYRRRGWLLRQRAAQSLVQADHPRIRANQPPGQALLGKQHGGARVLEHDRDALRRIVWIDRHIGGAGLEDRQQPDDQVGRALHIDADERLDAHALLLQNMRKLVGALVELAVG